MRILYVEDDEINAIVVKRLLRDYDVSRVKTPGEALDLVAKEQFSLILMDINLGRGHMDGTELMKEIKSRFVAYQQVPFFAVTAYALPEDRQRFLDEGFDDYFPKPVKREPLCEAIERLH